MAQGFDALKGDGAGTSPVVYIDLLKMGTQGGISGLTAAPSNGVLGKTILAQIRGALSQGQCVVVSPWKPDGPPLQCDEESLEMLRGGLEQNVEWQCERCNSSCISSTLTLDFTGAYRRQTNRDESVDEQSMYRSCSLREFIWKADDPSECGNLLDIPDSEGDVPWFIKWVFSLLFLKTSLISH
jgi:hypothetical protein